MNFPEFPPFDTCDPAYNPPLTSAAAAPTAEDMSSKSHPGFAKVQQSIARREGVSPKAAGAILASASRNASPAAKRANPALNKVSGRGR